MRVAGVLQRIQKQIDLVKREIGKLGFLDFELAQLRKRIFLVPITQAAQFIENGAQVAVAISCYQFVIS